MPTPIAPSVFGPPEPAKWNVDDILQMIRTDAMVESYADQAYANAKVEQMRPFVTAIDALMPQIQSANAQTSGDAIRRAVEIMRRAGLGDGKIFAFLNGQQVSDQALRVAGLNPQQVNPERQIKALIPTITGSNKEAATRALREALTMLKDFRGYKGPEPFYHWLSKNVKDDDVLRGAGIDPEEMRRATHPGDPHPDVAALLEISRSMMAALLRQNPELANANADSGQAAAAFRAFTGTAPALPAAPIAPAARLTVRDLMAIPIRG